MRGAQDLHQLLAQGEGHQEPDARQGHAEARALGGHAEIAMERQLAAARDGVAVHHGDGGMPGALHPLENLRDPALGIALGVVLALAHLAEVHARAERRPSPRITTTRTSGFLSSVSMCSTSPFQHGAVHRVARRSGRFMREGGDTRVDLQQELVGHVVS